MILSFFVAGIRAFKAQDRLQACIDNGKAQFDGYQIKSSKGIAIDERDKIENEISIYLKAQRTFTMLGLRLYPKKSI